MQLTWLRAGCESIAECGEYTLAVFPDYTEKKWAFRVLPNQRQTVIYSENHNTREAAEAACEAWLDKHDKPVWHDATKWLSWAEWRGWRLLAYDGGLDCGCVGRCVNGRVNAIGGFGETISFAKASAEKYVREQTGGAA